VASFGLLGRFNTTPEVWNVYPLGDTKPTLLQELCAWNFSGVPDNLRQVDALEKKDKICFHQFAYAFPDPENVAATVSCNSRNVL
jgi:hypothetical protein